MFPGCGRADIFLAEGCAVNYKIKPKKMPELANGRVKRTGRTYFEVAYWAGNGWKYKDFDTRAQAKEFTGKLV